MEINADKNNAIILTEETLKKLAEKISYRKGISAVVLSTDVEIAEVDNIKEQAIYLKVVVSGLTRTCYYSYDNENWTKVATLENCIYLCDEGVPDDPKRHTGTLVGIYANNGGCGSRIPADFDWFKYENRRDALC